MVPTADIVANAMITKTASLSDARNLNILSMFCSSLLGLPFSYYSTFVIEEKYGFNRTTLKTFVLDLLKEII